MKENLWYASAQAESNKAKIKTQWEKLFSESGTPDINFAPGTASIIIPDTAPEPVPAR